MLEAQIIALAGAGENASDIASALGLEKSAVELALSRHGLIQEEDIPKEDYQEILDGIIHTAKYSEHEHLKLRAGMFIVEQRRTRENLKHAPTLNILTINQLIQNAHNKVMNSLGMGEKEDDENEKPIDVEAVLTPSQNSGPAI